MKDKNLPCAAFEIKDKFELGKFRYKNFLMGNVLSICDDEYFLNYSTSMNLERHFLECVLKINIFLGKKKLYYKS